MPRRTGAQRKSGRRLATVLFLDIVGSTTVAAEMGDARWRVLLGRFRDSVQRQLKACGGREEGFTGDGFLATFAQPADAVRAAALIIDDVHELGLEVRIGLHTAEIETIDGEVGGVAVHAAARVLALGGPNQILVTSTLKDLVAGAPFRFEDAGMHELRGVPGSWHLFAVTDIDDRPVAGSVEPDAAASVRAAAVEEARAGRRRRWVVAVGAVIGICALVAVLVAMASRAAPTITMIQIDPSTGQVTRTITDGYYSHHHQDSLWDQNGTIWQATATEVVGRDPVTGAVRFPLALDGQIENGTFGLGFGWTSTPKTADTSTISKVDLVSGNVVAETDVPGPVQSIATGNDAVWTVTESGVLARVDPARMQDPEVWSTSAAAAGAVVPEAGYVWICDCEHGRIVRFDPQTERERVFHLPEHGLIVNVAGGSTDTAWILDPAGSTLTEIDPKTGALGQPIGLGSNPAQATIAFGSIWVAAGANVYEIDLQTLHKTTIPVPEPAYAGSIAADPKSGTIWVANCGCPR
jgi:class 3 adenylate cyclase/streptogramin lyase